MGAKHHFHTADFVVFGLTIVISIGIGIYYAFSGGRQKTTSEYLVGGRAMKFIPVAISLLASFQSSIMMLGFPAEAYVYGIQYIIGTLGYTVALILSVSLVVPLLHPLKITSANEYLEHRFQSRWVRKLGTFMSMLTFVWYIGVVLFGPAVALEAVTGFPQWSSIFVIALVAVLYTSVGGLKAVIWTDVFQAVVMCSGIVTILIKGTVDTGGPKQVWDVAMKGGRLNFFNFDLDPRTRHTFWSLFVSQLIYGFGQNFNQNAVQRISSTGSQSEARRMLLLAAPGYFLLSVLACYEGVVAYAYYETKKCDPFASNQLTNPNQIIPFVVMDLFSSLPGMPGLFLASLFSASLSTLSSGLSSLSALLWADILHPIAGQNISEWKATIIAKVSVLFFGALACAVAMIISQIGGTLAQITGSMVAALAGPMLALFLLGSLFPRANAKGAIFGGVIGLGYGIWLSLGKNFSPAIKQLPFLPPASTDNCPDDRLTNTTDHDFLYNYTTLASYFFYTTDATTNFTTTTVPEREPEGIEKMYTISYLWISVLGIFSTIIFGLLGSLVTGMNKPGHVDPRYLIAISDSVLIWLPRRLRRWISSIGPQYMKEEYKERFPDPAKLKEQRLETELDIKPSSDDLDAYSDVHKTML